MLYRCNILYNKFISLSIFYQLVRIAPRSSPGAAPAYVGIVVLVGGGGGGGVVVAPAVVAKIARPTPAFAVGRSDAASRPPRHGVRPPVESPRRLLPCLPLAPPLVLRRRTVIGQHTLLDAGGLGLLGVRGGYQPRSSRKHDDHGALPPCPKSCQTMTRTWDTSAKKYQRTRCG
jgi:hypothetical protein